MFSMTASNAVMQFLFWLQLVMTMLPFEDITVSRQVQVLVQSLQLPATTLEWIHCCWLQSLLLWWPNKWKYFCCNILCHFSRKLGNKTIRWDIFWSGKYTTWDNTPLEQHLIHLTHSIYLIPKERHPQVNFQLLNLCWMTLNRFIIIGAHFQNCYLQSIPLRIVCVCAVVTKCRWSWRTRFTTSRWNWLRKPLLAGAECRV